MNAVDGEKFPSAYSVVWAVLFVWHVVEHCLVRKLARLHFPLCCWKYQRWTIKHAPLFGEFFGLGLCCGTFLFSRSAKLLLLSERSHVVTAKEATRRLLLWYSFNSCGIHLSRLLPCRFDSNGRDCCSSVLLIIEMYPLPISFSYSKLHVIFKSGTNAMQATRNKTASERLLQTKTSVWKEWGWTSEKKRFKNEMKLLNTKLCALKNRTFRTGWLNICDIVYCRNLPPVLSSSSSVAPTFIHQVLTVQSHIAFCSKNLLTKTHDAPQFLMSVAFTNLLFLSEQFYCISTKQ